MFSVVNNRLYRYSHTFIPRQNAEEELSQETLQPPPESVPSLRTVRWVIPNLISATKQITKLLNADNLEQWHEKDCVQPSPPRWPAPFWRSSSSSSAPPCAWRLMGMYGDRKAQRGHCVLCGNNLTAAQHGAKWLPGQVRAKIAITSQQQVINKVIVKLRWRSGCGSLCAPSVFICMFGLLNPQKNSEPRQQGTIITVWHEAHHLLAQQPVSVSISAPVCEVPHYHRQKCFYQSLGETALFQILRTMLPLLWSC